jgi:hypothetical protein
MATYIIVEMKKFKMTTTKKTLRREMIVFNGHYSEGKNLMDIFAISPKNKNSGILKPNLYDV